MNRKQTITAIAIALSIVAGAAVATSQVSAHNAGYQDSMVERLSERFGLSQDEVRSFFDEQHAEHENQMQQAYEERLSALVSNGTITEEQKQALLAKHEEMKEAREMLRDMDPEERREEAQRLHDELEEWAEDQGIDLSQIMPMRHHHGHRLHMGI